MILHFTKLGTGARGGENWANAAEIETFAGRIRQARPGDRFLIGFDRDREDPVFYAGRPMSLSASGTEAMPIRVHAGYIGDDFDIQPQNGPGRHIFFKNPAASIRRRGSRNGGGRYLTLDANASHLRLSGFRVEGAPADGFFKFGTGREKGTFRDIVIQGMGATNIGRMIECDDNTAIEDLTLEDCDAAQISRGFARFRSLSNSTLRNIFLDADYVDGGGGNLCQLIHVAEGKNVVFENMVMRNAMNLNTGERGGYVQGDGLVAESGTSQFVIRNCHSNGMGDGGFDLKTVGVRLENCSASHCKFGIRIWSNAQNTIQRCAIASPRTTGATRGACVQTVGRVEIVDSELQAGAGTMVFNFDGERDASNRSIRVVGGSVRMDAGAVLVGGAARGALELHNVAVNGIIRNATYSYTGKDLL